MLVEELRQLYRREPFQPIEFELADGRRFVVPRRGTLLISEDGRSCGVMKLDGDLNSPSGYERGEEPFWFRGDQIVRVGYIGEASPGSQRSAG